MARNGPKPQRPKPLPDHYRTIPYFVATPPFSSSLNFRSAGARAKYKRLSVFLNPYSSFASSGICAYSVARLNPHTFSQTRLGHGRRKRIDVCTLRVHRPSETQNRVKTGEGVGTKRRVVSRLCSRMNGSRPATLTVLLSVRDGL